MKLDGINDDGVSGWELCLVDGRVSSLVVRGSYAVCVAALESWDSGALYTAGGGNFEAVYAVESLPDVLSHVDALLAAPYIVGTTLVDAFGRCRHNPIRLRRMGIDVVVETSRRGW